jgi:hypothetical protein
MALSFTAAAKNDIAGGSNTTVTCTLPVAVAAGDVVIVAAFGGGGAGTPASLTISDSSGDTYTDSGLGLVALGWFTGAYRVGMFLTPTVGVTNFTMTIPVANEFIEIFAWKVSGFTGTPTKDKVVSASGNGATADSGSSGTLTDAAEAAIGYVLAENGSNSAGSGWTIGGTNINDGISNLGDLGEHRITSATTAINATAAINSGNWDAVLLTVYDAVADTLAAQVWM